MPLRPPDFLALRLALPVAILGEGVSGQGALALISALGAPAVIYDARGMEFTARSAARHRLVIFSPGFRPDHPWLEAARSAGCECLGELDFGSLFWRGRVIAVTGTNGKTTLTEFLAHALREAGRPAIAAGNIGRSFSQIAASEDFGPEATAVCEVSSFQAETLRHFKAEATLWTNFAEDHLERHGDMDAYFAAKAVLVARSGAVFAGSSVRAWTSKQKEPSVASVVWVPTEGQPEDSELKGTAFFCAPQRENFILAMAWWSAAGLPPASLYAAARSFRIGRHRLAWVAEIEGVAFWNDSKATNFHAVEAALAGFDAPIFLIAGGRAKGGDIAGFVRRIAPRVRRAFLIGETATELARACAKAGVAHAVCATLAEAVRTAAAAARSGEHVLLSPAFASFDMFRNYEDRGDQFERLVREISATASVH